MCIYVYIDVDLSLSLSLYIYIYIYIYLLFFEPVSNNDVGLFASHVGHDQFPL